MQIERAYGYISLLATLLQHSDTSYLSKVYADNMLILEWKRDFMMITSCGCRCGFEKLVQGSQLEAGELKKKAQQAVRHKLATESEAPKEKVRHACCCLSAMSWFGHPVDAPKGKTESILDPAPKFETWFNFWCMPKFAGHSLEV